VARWADRSFLRDVQYRTDVNLAARQSIYRYQQPPADVGHDRVPLVGERFSLDQGEVLLRRMFASVVRYDFPGRLVLPGPEPVSAYVRSMSITAQLADSDALIRAVTSRLLPNGQAQGDLAHPAGAGHAG